MPGSTWYPQSGGSPLCVYEIRDGVSKPLVTPGGQLVIKRILSVSAWPTALDLMAKAIAIFKRKDRVCQ